LDAEGRKRVEDLAGDLFGSIVAGDAAAGEGLAHGFEFVVGLVSALMQCRYTRRPWSK